MKLNAGGGAYASYTPLPINLAWEAFEIRNWAASYSEMRRQLLRYREIPDNPHEVSPRLKEEFKNGRSCYSFDVTRLHHMPSNRSGWLLKELLIWHNENKFRS